MVSFSHLSRHPVVITIIATLISVRLRFYWNRPQRSSFILSTCHMMWTRSLPINPAASYSALIEIAGVCTDINFNVIIYEMCHPESDGMRGALNGGPGLTCTYHVTGWPRLLSSDVFDLRTTN